MTSDAAMHKQYSLLIGSNDGVRYDVTWTFSPPFNGPNVI